ncbi:hypothetical protein HCZ23_06895 [Celeribacter sp. HF31]|uniref:hypothetical protein n=1 Tax=Celeribacter sp. HF31 TaxID=2721558 RepID=UPI0014320EAE|nr:hypothetical protein [Celeribacter sp. HF31]NIY79195.1 hypothetical protein [Celeribacter sp. HF31]
MKMADFFGLLAGILLFIPPFLDQVGRLGERTISNYGKKGRSIKKFSKELLNIKKLKRDRFSSRDFLFMMLGGLSLIISYGISLTSPP